MAEKPSALTFCELEPDGGAIVLGTGDGRAAARLSIDDATALLMTLPALIEAALRATTDDGARHAFPLDSWTIEADEEPGMRLMTLRAAGGFAVRFVLPEDGLDGLAASLAASRRRAAGSFGQSASRLDGVVQSGSAPDSRA